MAKLNSKTIIPSSEEDAEINRGIAADPDTFDPKDGFAHLKPVNLKLPGRPLGSGSCAQGNGRMGELGNGENVRSFERGSFC